MKWLTCTLIAAMALVLGCGKNPGKPKPVVVVYTSVDDPIARPILEAFGRDTGIEVKIKTDSEATKTAGLASLLEAERQNPRADVWWGNEPFHTCRLAERGLLAKYDSPAAATIPAMYKDPDGMWAGTGLRVRVLGVTKVLTREQEAQVKDLWPPKSIMDLTNPALKGKIAMARPSFGSTGGHVAAIFVTMRDEKATQFFKDLKANDIKLLGGNSEVARQVGKGILWAGLTDNDDVDSAAGDGGKIMMVPPDQGESAAGTLAIPCTVGLVSNAPHSENAKKLIDYLLSKEVEKRLIEKKFSRWSVFSNSASDPIKTMKVDYREVSKKLDASLAVVREIMGE